MDVRSIVNVEPEVEHNGTVPVWYLVKPREMHDLTDGGSLELVNEFEVAPGQVDSPYWSMALPEGSAVAWNPSLPGGAKDEDTFLVRSGVPEPVTLTTEWPLADDLLPARPAVLVLGL